jgi:hypothetical protein
MPGKVKPIYGEHEIYLQWWHCPTPAAGCRWRRRLRRALPPTSWHLHQTTAPATRTARHTQLRKKSSGGDNAIPTQSWSWSTLPLKKKKKKEAEGNQEVVGLWEEQRPAPVQIRGRRRAALMGLRATPPHSTLLLPAAGSQ